MPQLYLTQDGNINDSHPGYTSGVKLDISALSSMAENATYCKNVWFVDLGASNQMTNHAEWFSDVRNLEKLGYVEISDDIAHPIAQVGKVPLAMQDSKTKYL